MVVPHKLQDGALLKRMIAHAAGIRLRNGAQREFAPERPHLALNDEIVVLVIAARISAAHVGSALGVKPGRRVRQVDLLVLVHGVVPRLFEPDVVVVFCVALLHRQRGVLVGLGLAGAREQGGHTLNGFLDGVGVGHFFVLGFFLYILVLALVLVEVCDAARPALLLLAAGLGAFLHRGLLLGGGGLDEFENRLFVLELGSVVDGPAHRRLALFRERRDLIFELGDFSLERHLGLRLFGPLCLPLLDCVGEVRPAGLKQIVHGVHGLLDKFDRFSEVALVPSGLSAAVKLGDGGSGGVAEGVCWWLVRGEDGSAVAAAAGAVGGGLGIAAAAAAGVSGGATGALEEHGGADFASGGGRVDVDVDVDGRSMRGESGRKNRGNGAARTLPAAVYRRALSAAVSVGASMLRESQTG